MTGNSVIGSGMTDGIVIVDKPLEWTSHDVVARVRKLAGTRRVGHAGTLDPMATGVLVVGVGRATRLLGHLAMSDKDYTATIRLGVTTTTDDAEGDVVAKADASGLSDALLLACMASLTGEIEQVPSSFSAVKIGGVPAYKRARHGEEVVLEPRRVSVERFELLERRGDDVDVLVTCSSGTYVRALARDLGAALGVGAHLTALRRTRSGGFGVDSAMTLDELSAAFTVTPLSEAVAASFPRIDVDADTRQRLVYGQPVSLPVDGRPTGVFGPDGEVVALVARTGDRMKSLAVFSEK
jgi:tRNA pseudouridine55 synthase